MKIASIILILCIFLSLSAENISMNVTELLQHPELDIALDSINMTRKDLTFNLYKNEKDAFRLSYIDDLFKNPLQSFSLADSVSHKLWFAQEIVKKDLNLSNLLETAFQMTEISFQTNPPEIRINLSKKQKKQISKLSNCHQQVIHQILLIKSVQNEFYKAFSSLSPEDIKNIKDYFNNENQESEPVNHMDLKSLKAYTVKSNEKTKQIYQLIEKIQFEHIASASLMLQNIVQNIHSLIQNSEDTAFKQDKIELQTDEGNIFINPPQICNLDNALFVIDYQSNNIYQQTKNNPFLAVLDYSGNDRYEGKDYAQGGVFMGLQYFIDFSGDDFYTAASNAQGAACLGAGLLLDLSGNDYYNAENLVQGAGKLGIGILYDTDGNDQYYCSLYGQGFGYTKGFGTLSDLSGNDTYIVKKSHVDWLRYDSHYESLSQGCGLGIRPYYSGGCGILADQNGSDTYISDIYGQGTAYWYAFGALVDKKGHDQYISHQYAQGSGVHLAFAVLIDSQGDDLYKSHGVSQGCGHDLAFGGLMDIKGNDNYVCYDLSQGGGNANAISFFMDYSGNDGYIAKKDNVMGYSDMRRSFGYIGIFLDLNGDDQYGSPIGTNNKTWMHSYYGVGLDKQSLNNSEQQNMTDPPAEQPDIELNDNIEDLFLYASAQAQALAHMVQPARNKLIEMGEKSIPYLLNQLNTELIREQLALTETLPKMGKIVYPYFEETLKDTTKTSFVISLIGLSKDSTAFYLIEPFLVSDNPFKYQAIKASGELRNSKALPCLIQSLKDPSVSIRRESCIALQKISDIQALQNLVNCLDDEYQEVRYSAEIAIKNINPLPVKDLKKVYASCSDRQKKHLDRLLKYQF